MTLRIHRYATVQRRCDGVRYWCVYDRHEGVCAWFTSSWQTVVTVTAELTAGTRFTGMQWLELSDRPSPTVRARRLANLKCETASKVFYLREHGDHHGRRTA